MTMDDVTAILEARKIKGKPLDLVEIAALFEATKAAERALSTEEVSRVLEDPESVEEIRTAALAEQVAKLKEQVTLLGEQVSSAEEVRFSSFEDEPEDKPKLATLEEKAAEVEEEEMKDKAEAEAREEEEGSSEEVFVDVEEEIEEVSQFMAPQAPAPTPEQEEPVTAGSVSDSDQVEHLAEILKTKPPFEFEQPAMGDQEMLALMAEEVVMDQLSPIEEETEPGSSSSETEDAPRKSRSSQALMTPIEEETDSVLSDSEAKPVEMQKTAVEAYLKSLPSQMPIIEESTAESSAAEELVEPSQKETLPKATVSEIIEPAPIFFSSVKSPFRSKAPMVFEARLPLTSDSESETEPFGTPPKQQYFQPKRQPSGPVRLTSTGRSPEEIRKPIAQKVSAVPGTTPVAPKPNGSSVEIGKTSPLMKKYPTQQRFDVEEDAPQYAEQKEEIPLYAPEVVPKPVSRAPPPVLTAPVQSVIAPPIVRPPSPPVTYQSAIHEAPPLRLSRPVRVKPIPPVLTIEPSPEMPRKQFAEETSPVFQRTPTPPEPSPVKMAPFPAYQQKVSPVYTPPRVEGRQQKVSTPPSLPTSPYLKTPPPVPPKPKRPKSWAGLSPVSPLQMKSPTPSEDTEVKQILLSPTEAKGKGIPTEEDVRMYISPLPPLEVGEEEADKHVQRTYDEDETGSLTYLETVTVTSPPPQQPSPMLQEKSPTFVEREYSEDETGTLTFAESISIPSVEVTSESELEADFREEDEMGYVERDYDVDKSGNLRYTEAIRSPSPRLSRPQSMTESELEYEAEEVTQLPHQQPRHPSSSVQM
ncbi:PREDICTED: proline-rich protein 36-like [Branchiostoma belcheri]|uniref:Proline-rich protein 36-like n=1 Tax=Branchiostoma belcheri TaxID=7741 RepID=A0A6P4XZ32_BRABE|nr:PREDICTED: proline-rich protein 36-like [Branchiostoma belcheri]